MIPDKFLEYQKGDKVFYIDVGIGQLIIGIVTGITEDKSSPNGSISFSTEINGTVLNLAKPFKEEFYPTIQEALEAHNRNLQAQIMRKTDELRNFRKFAVSVGCNI